MSEIRLLEGRVNSANSRIPFLITGFGFLRSISDDPWFKFTDMVATILEGPTKKLIQPSKGGYSGILTMLEVRGYMQNNGREITEGSKRNQDLAPRIVGITELGREAMLNTAVYMVTHEGLTLPDILYIPGVVSAVLNESDFPDRLLAAVSGTPFSQ